MPVTKKLFSTNHYFDTINHLLILFKPFIVFSKSDGGESDIFHDRDLGV
jgi:hypothetical protein